MRLIAVFTLAVLATACAAAPPRPDLVATAGTAPAAEIDAAFRQSLVLRYGADAGRMAMLSDLGQAGFACTAKVKAVAAARDAVLDVCERTRPAAKAGCSDTWSVDLRFKSLSRALDSERVEPVGRFTRACG